MQKQVQKRVGKDAQAEQKTEEPVKVDPEEQSRIDGIDEILDGIDEILEQNADTFVKQFVQKGGE